MRQPDLKIGPGYMDRWYVIPRNKWFNVYLHKIMQDDDDRALHDHPWWSLSIKIKGLMCEQRRGKPTRTISNCLPIFRRAKDAHRLQIINGPVWTIFITGRRSREWGFYCGDRWVHWRDFTSGLKGETIGKGCDQ